MISWRPSRFREIAPTWMVSSACVSPTLPTDLLDYIQSVIASALSNLPSAMKQFIYFGAFDHLSGKMMSILRAPDTKKIQVGFVKNFEHDLSHLEAFVKDIDGVSLGDCFGELRQVSLTSIALT